MDKSVVYERDLLYPTESITDPGSIHIEVLNPKKTGRMPIIIESKTNHSPVKYINSITRIMQSDIFDRIHIEVEISADIYIKLGDELKSEFGGKNYLLVKFNGDKIEYKGMDEIE